MNYYFLVTGVLTFPIISGSWFISIHKYLVGGIIKSKDCSVIAESEQRVVKSLEDKSSNPPETC